ncbi:MAG: lysophospholipid acyltransferase family protein, partial [Myxococcota bacterium]
MDPTEASNDGQRPSDAEESTSPVDLGFLGALDPASLRAALPSFLANFVEDGASDRAAANRARIASLVGSWSDDACRAVISDLGGLGREHRPYPANPDCRALSRLWCHDVVEQAQVHGAEHLRAAVERGPALVCCNHLSYVDSTATDAALAGAGHADLADRLIAAAGPKVYQDLFRLIAASCLNTLPVPQSTSFTHTEKLSARELARKASESLQSAADAMASGYVLLLYPEGSRSRTGHLGSFLRGAHRYLTALPDLSVVPLGIAGTEALMPVASSKLRPGTVTLRFGAPLRAGPDGNSRELLAT